MFFRMLLTSRLSLGIKHMHNSFTKLNPWAAELHRAVHPNKHKLVSVRLGPLSSKICSLCLTVSDSKNLNYLFLPLQPPILDIATFLTFWYFIDFDNIQLCIETDWFEHKSLILPRQGWEVKCNLNRQKKSLSIQPYGNNFMVKLCKEWKEPIFERFIQLVSYLEELL